MTIKDGKENFEDILATWTTEWDQRKAKAKEIMYLLLEQHPHITAIDAMFDGCGDAGQVEEIRYAGATGEVITGIQELDDAIEEYVYSILPPGWEINDGSFGTIEIDVNARKTECNFSWRATEDASFTEE